jgi:hypothetical protein
MRYRWSAAVLIVGLLAGCGGAAGDQVPTSTPGDPLPESTFVPGPSASYRGLILTGLLVLDDDGCVRLDADAGSMTGAGPTDIAWPVGTTLRTLGPGRAEVLWPDGTVVARTGERMRASGGAGSSADPGPCLDPDEAFTLEAVLPAP